ncbi:MAG: carbamoyltransferase N-terminal domain-containing protein, partial [Elusimicrobiota bacterium]
MYNESSALLMSDPKTAVPSSMRWPVTDAFGTRLEPADLLEAVASGIGRDFSLTLDDEGAVLRVSPEAGGAAQLEAVLSLLKDRLAGWSVRLEEGRVEPRDQGRLMDGRRVPVLTAALVELGPGPAQAEAGARLLLSRLGLRESVKRGRAAAGLGRSPGGKTEASSFAASLAGVLPRFGLDPGEAVVVGLNASGSLAGPIDTGTGPFFLVWSRPEGRGFKPGVFAAASLEGRTIQWLAEQLADFPGKPLAGFRVLLDGLERGVLRRPTLAALAPARAGVVADSARCLGCGTCARVCPAGRLAKAGKVKTGKTNECLRCFDCVEACPSDSLRPVYGFTSAMRGEAASDQAGWLSRLRGRPGPAMPAAFPPSYLLPKPGPVKKPSVILGLAVNTMQEHAAALVVDGRLVGAVEEEKLSRVRHHGWPLPGQRRFGFALEESFCRRAIRLLLAKQGLDLDDVDLIAVNGLPPRYGLAYAGLGPDKPLPVIRSGRLLFIPHHLCHAASAFRLSGQKESWVLTVDGRGERQTAAVFHAKGGSIRQVYELRSLVRRSIGGVYESVTRLLGFGTHGQGIVMALASMGKASVPFGRWLSWKGPEDMSIDEDLGEALAGFRRDEDADLEPRHRDLAASLQKALEDSVLAILGRFVPSRPKGLCLAGGVALNCRMN